MEIEEAGSPERIAGEIHRQIVHPRGAVPVEEIALSLDILEIRSTPLRNFEAALLMTPDRNRGSILVNEGSRKPRQRFGIAHELGHFLIVTHVPTTGNGFGCTKRDMAARGPGDRLQEAEANRFAIELLAPKNFIGGYLRGVPDLERALEFAERLKISNEAAARRYVALQGAPLAVVMSQNGRILYSDISDRFPRLALGTGDPLPALPARSGFRTVTMMETVDPREWLRGSFKGELAAQSLLQTEGYAITLLHAELPYSED